MTIPLHFTKLSDCAITPTIAYGEALGFDLYAPNNDDDFPLTIPPGFRELIHCNIAIEFPPGIGGFIKDRSGNALKSGLHVIGGVIDSNYRGSVGAILVNLSRLSVVIEPCTRIAQLVLIPCISSKYHLEEKDSLAVTNRGSKGFGSSGE